MHRYYNNNKDRFVEYRANNKDRRNTVRRKRHAENPVARITHSLRSRLLNALNGTTKSASTITLLGTTPDKLKDYLETKFVAGMSWENYGYSGWHIDHIRPCASFDLLDPAQQRKCFHYTNLQPMWASENISKQDKWSGNMHVEMEMSF